MPNDLSHKKTTNLLRNNILIRHVERLNLHSHVRHAEIGALAKVIQGSRHLSSKEG
jgi:hypothetical protein